MPESYPDVMVLLPGITGSELVRDGKVIWGWSGGALLRNLISAGDALNRDLRVENDSPTAAQLDDGVKAKRLLPDLHLIPGLWKVDGYSSTQEYLVKTFNLEHGRNFFPFPYDWRRDNRAAAHRLREQSAGWLAKWRTDSGNVDAKLVLIAHSMGGLISRYFLEVLEGWRNTRALITFGTPYAGSMNAVDTLVNGSKKFGLDLTDTSRQMNSLHQLLPTYKCCQLSNGSFERLRDVPLPGIDAKRLANAMDFHDEIRASAQRNADIELYRDHRYGIYPIVGYNQPTRNSLRLEGDGIELLESLGDTQPGGDGTVPRQSAAPAGFDLPTAMHASAKHGELQNHLAALNHVGGLISSLAFRSAFRGATTEMPVHVSLDVEDFHLLRAPVPIRAKPSVEGKELFATVTDRSDHKTVKQGRMQMAADGWQDLVFEPPHAGLYNVTVGGKQGMVEPVRDVIEVVDTGG